MTEHQGAFSADQIEAVARAICGVACPLGRGEWDQHINEARAALTALSATPEYRALVEDGERYRWLRNTLHSAVGGGVWVNEENLYYETPEPGKEVVVQWYPVTPVGCFISEASTLDAAIDAARRAER